MIYNDRPSEKGLFTFYIEQNLQEQQLHNLTKDKKNINPEQYIPSKHTKKEKPKPSQRSIISTLSKKQVSEKGKASPSKQRLKESIIDMGKNSQLNNFKTVHRSPPSPIRIREMSLVIKASLSNASADPSIYSSQQNVHYTPELSREEFNIMSFQRHKKTQKLASPLKEYLHTPHGSVVELPQIRSPEEVKRESRPKKTIKSMLIQEALHSGDRARIKQIRQYLRKDSPVGSWRENGAKQDDALARSMRVFEFRQQKLLEILQRFKKQW